eukprot:Phypoly_transcript_26010.p1 GENE.Phypoly_transcript_26010~~Phypoly_transcript_26010.p1  ORF type:complete len:110 (+),score=17.17 Phypoly_transcript_26010:98-427(+)
MFRAKMSMWPGLSGPCIPIHPRFIRDKLFIGMSSGKYTHESDSYFASVNDLVFANGYNLFVKPSFGDQVPEAAMQYLQQFAPSELVESLAMLEDVKRRRQEEEQEGVTL